LTDESSTKISKSRELIYQSIIWSDKPLSYHYTSAKSVAEYVSHLFPHSADQSHRTRVLVQSFIDSSSGE